MKFPNSEFWSFSTQTYQIPEVETACLNLQNNVSADVNILLYCCWVAEKHLQLSLDETLLLIQATDPWQNAILIPLRDVRRMLKQQIIVMPAELRDQTVSNMLEMEINAERMEQQALEKAVNLTDKAVSDDKTPIEIATANLSLYLQQLQAVDAINSVSADLTQLLDAIYQDAEAIQMALMANAG